LRLKTAASVSLESEACW